MASLVKELSVPLVENVLDGAIVNSYIRINSGEAKV